MNNIGFAEKSFLFLIAALARCFWRCCWSLRCSGSFRNRPF